MLPKHATVALALLTVSLTVSLMGLSQAQLKDGCKMETLRACGEDYVPFAKTSHMESSGPVFEKQCETFKQQITCSNQFSKDCLDGLSKAAALLTLEAFQDNVDATCIKGSEQHEAFQNSVGCLNSVGKEINGCFKDIRESLQLSVAKAPPKEVIHYVCCSYGDLLGCLDQTLAPCENDGGKKFITGLLEQALGEPLSLVCGNYRSGSENCKALQNLPLLGPNDRKIDGFLELLIEASKMVGRTN
ncbi:uncharacterized protein LOC119458275 [Dermacentor silvarum]|uniref:uncharacterized protein LOC119458275 n=1 Tax=Dermacentor silvarum TaxID=543639 RepID=UPI00189AFF74|nr:uncharacterized protein LOC119458275 [Dermacentor silvarum]